MNTIIHLWDNSLRKVLVGNCPEWLIRVSLATARPTDSMRRASPCESACLIRSVPPTQARSRLQRHYQVVDRRSMKLRTDSSGFAWET